MVQERIGGMDEKVVIKCQEQQRKKTCNHEAVGYIVVTLLGTKKPLCAAHLLECISYGAEFGPIGNLLHPPVKVRACD